MPTTTHEHGRSEKLGLIPTVALGVTSIIGAGIFVLSNEASKVIGGAVLPAFALGLVASLVLAVCYAELGSMHEGSGGPYLYAREAFGVRAACVVGWCNVGAWSCASGYVTLGIANYAGVLFSSQTNGRLFATGIVCVFTVANLLGVKVSGTVQTFILVAESCALLAFIGFGLSHVTESNVTTLPPSANLGNFFTASLMGFLALTGWDAIVVASGDIKDSKRVVPKAIIVSIMSVGLLYLGALLVLVGSTGSDELRRSTSPLEHASRLIFGQWGSLGFTLTVIVGLSATANAFIIVISRSLGSLQADNLLKLPKLSNRNHFSKDYNLTSAVLLAGGIELVILWESSIDVAVKGTGVMYTLTFLASVLSLAFFVFRRHERGAIKTPMPIVWIPVAAGLCLAFIVSSGWLGVMVAAGVVAMGCLLSYAAILNTKRMGVNPS